MDIPANIRVGASLIQSAVFYFKEESFENSENPHYFIVLNNAPKQDETLALVYASSKIEKVRHRRKNCLEQTLVEIAISEYREFTLPTMIDCNSVIEISPAKLIEKLESGDLKICENMPASIFGMIRAGVLMSRVVEMRVKKLVLGDN